MTKEKNGWCFPQAAAVLEELRNDAGHQLNELDAALEREGEQLLAATDAQVQSTLSDPIVTRARVVFAPRSAGEAMVSHCLFR